MNRHTRPARTRTDPWSRQADRCIRHGRSRVCWRMPRWCGRLLPRNSKSFGKP